MFRAPPRYFHSSVLIGPLLITFGGCEGADLNEANCFRNDTHVYNILCGTWEELSLPGLPANSSRYGHSSVVDGSDGSLLVYGGYLGTFHHDLLRLNAGDCGQFGTESLCLNGSSLCAWTAGTGECVRVGSMSGGLTYQCPVGEYSTVAHIVCEYCTVLYCSSHCVLVLTNQLLPLCTVQH